MVRFLECVNQRPVLRSQANVGKKTGIPESGAIPSPPARCFHLVGHLGRGGLVDGQNHRLALQSMTFGRRRLIHPAKPVGCDPRNWKLHVESLPRFEVLTIRIFTARHALNFIVTQSAQLPDLGTTHGCM